jgi:hypothetical protein
MDEPGIEPGAFRMQSGRATTALHALSNIILYDQDITNLLLYIDETCSNQTSYRF